MPTANPTRKPPTPVPPCPDCKGELALKSGQYGVFYSCTKYPSCKGQHPADKKTGKPIDCEPADTPTREARKKLRKSLDALVERLGGSEAAADVVKLWLDKASDEKDARIYRLDQSECEVLSQRADEDQSLLDALRKAAAKRMGA